MCTAQTKSLEITELHEPLQQSWVIVQGRVWSLSQDMEYKDCLKHLENFLRKFMKNINNMFPPSEASTHEIAVTAQPVILS